MKIAFDGRYAEGNLAGIGKYAKSLLQELDKRGIRCVIFYSKEPKYKIHGKNIKSVVLRVKNRYLFEQIALPFALAKEQVDLYHAVGNIGIPLVCPVPSILTVHDIIPLEIKNYFSYSQMPFLSKFSYLFRLTTSIFKANKIVTVSSYVKKELAEKLRVSSIKIQTIHSGSPSFDKEGRLPDKLKNQKYILNNGGIDVRKNLNRLIDAFAIFHKKHLDYRLVITGNNKGIVRQLKKQVAKLKLGHSIVFTGYLDNGSLVAVIKNAEIICYPSLSEGFGFPVLEGFGLGIPVISSNLSSIPEIAGNAAILINPKNIVEIYRAMEKCISDKKLRKSMVSRGNDQYNKFRWDETANEYIALYNHI